MANHALFEELIANSLQVYPGMIAVWPQLHEQEAIIFDVAPFNGSYSSNNGTLAFVIDNTLYVTPSTREAHHALQELAFSQNNFYVPFSNWDYPKDEKDRWDALLENACKSRRKEFEDDCTKYCDEHGIGTLSDSILSNCFVMPETGVQVRYPHHIHCVHTHYPVINNFFLDSYCITYLGTYCTHNGKVVFVYRDGKTYVTKGSHILKSLHEARYVHKDFFAPFSKDLFVPFSEGETILDPVLAEQWEQIHE